MNNRNNIIIEELRQIAPHLAQIQLVNPFTVPVHYFETLQDEVLQKIQSEAGTTVLDSLQKENPFDVPYNYFESLPGKILNRIREEENKPTFAETILNKLGYLLKPKYALAAIALVIGITIFVGKMSNSTVNVPTLDAAEKQVTAQDVNDYISSNIDQFDEKSIVACVSNKQLDNAPFPMNSIDLNNQNSIDLSQIDDNTIKEIAM
jgi:hypothetical protein